MTGVVRGREARFTLRLRGPSGRRATVEAMLDTGYTGALTLPRPSLPPSGSREPAPRAAFSRMEAKS
jgi:hypothetical protein